MVKAALALVLMMSQLTNNLLLSNTTWIKDQVTFLETLSLLINNLQRKTYIQTALQTCLHKATSMVVEDNNNTSLPSKRLLYMEERNNHINSNNSSIKSLCLEEDTFNNNSNNNSNSKTPMISILPRDKAINSNNSLEASNLTSRLKKCLYLDRELFLVKTVGQQQTNHLWDYSTLLVEKAV